tara:strand:+ start:3622 stop:3870 length:249 start_codon:yes stop_codon:yes gene_type:complete
MQIELDFGIQLVAFKLRKSEVKMVQVFKENGYEIAMFGKWHLGDTSDARPQFKGFDYTLIHGGEALDKHQNIGIMIILMIHI